MTDDELVNMCRDFRNSILNGGSAKGMCVAVSTPLAGYLRALCGIACECVQTDLSDNDNSEFYEHVWIKLADGRVLDATFDQFCSEEPVPVYLGKPTEFHANPVRLTQLERS